VAHAPAQVIVPQDRWQLIDFVNGEKALRKTYRFFSVSNRNTFLNELFESDNDVVRSREVKVNKLSVDVILGTPHLGVPTEIDKEFAKFLDDLYRDVSFDANV
jgi:pterin-4a-carbinolamine dehydratase